MKEIIPLKKDVIFKTIIGEICNISLDYDYKIDNDLVNGCVDVSGSYRMTEASVLEEDFFYSVPFSISISKNVKKDTINIEIDDFKYSINKDVLSLSIDLCLNCDEDESIYKEDNMEIDNPVDEYFNDVDLLNLKSDSDNTINNIENDNFNINDNDINKSVDINNNEVNTNINDITNNLSDNKYYTYKVYIVRSGDTIDSICNKYNVNINDLKDYNDIDNINIGQKIIIPQINE